MPAKVVCPTCHMSLNAPEDVLGQAIKCEECGATFTARVPARPRPGPGDRPAAKSRPSRRREDDEDEDDRLSRRTRSRRDDDEDDDRPARRPKRKAKGSSALPFILAGGGLVLFVLVAVAVGGYFLLKASPKANGPGAGNNANAFAPLPNNAPPVQPVNPGVQPQPRPQPGQQPPPVGGQKVTLSNARWSGPFGDFSVDYKINGGGRLAPLCKLRTKSSDGSTSEATLHMGPFDGESGTWTIKTFGGGMGRGRRGGLEIWVEEGGVGLIAGTRISNTVTLN